MKNLLLLATVSASGLFAQTLTGTWQGTLHMPDAPGGQLRIVFKIAPTANSTFAATMYSIDHSAEGFPSNRITLQGDTVKIAVPGVGASFVGTLAADGSSIAGNWRQEGPNPVPLNLVRATEQSAWPIPESMLASKPMDHNADPSFAVATIKPAQPGRLGVGVNIQGHRLSASNMTLSDLITFTYRIHPRQLLGGPEWVRSDRYDITAQPDGEGQPNDEQWRSMLQKLLADRYQLKFHSDKKELAVYALTVAKSGTKLTKSSGDLGGSPAIGFRGRLGALGARYANMGDFASSLQRTVLDRPVIDQTGITGRYDFTLDWTPDEFQFATIPKLRQNQPTADSNSAPDLFTAIQQQLGLKLESTKAQTEVLVIERVEKPSAN